MEKKEKYKILIIEDELSNINAIKRTLRKESYDIKIAENGRIALDLIDEYDPIVVLLDLNMPIMNGFEFLEHIGHTSVKSYSIIVLSGLGNSSDIEVCYSYGISNFINKPYNPIILREQIKSLIKMKNFEKGIERIHKKEMEIKEFETFQAMVITANHEINQPLAVILGTTQLLQQKIQSSKNKREFDLIVSNINRIETILTSLREIKIPKYTSYANNEIMIDIHSKKK